MADLVKVIVNLTEDNFNIVEKLAEETGQNKTTIINKAIMTEKFLSEAVSEGKKILVQDKDGTLQQVVFR